MIKSGYNNPSNLSAGNCFEPPQVTVANTVTQRSPNKSLHGIHKNGCRGDYHFVRIDSKNSKLYLTWFIAMQGSLGPVGAPGLPGSTGNPVSFTYSAVLVVFLLDSIFNVGTFFGI